MLIITSSLVTAASGEIKIYQSDIKELKTVNEKFVEIRTKDKMIFKVELSPELANFINSKKKLKSEIIEEDITREGITVIEQVQLIMLMPKTNNLFEGTLAIEERTFIKGFN